MFSLSSLFSKNQSAAFLKAAAPVVVATNAFTKELQALSDDELRARLEGVRSGALNAGAAKSDIPLVFALVREASRRTLRQPHFDVQLVGGLALLEGKISEMRTRA